MKLNIILISIISVLAICLQYYRLELIRETNLNKFYKNNQELLLKQIGDIYEDKLKLQKSKEMLEKAAKKDEPIFNWKHDISDTNVIIWLQSH